MGYLVQEAERRLQEAIAIEAARAEADHGEARELAQTEAKEAAEVAELARSKFPPMTHLLYQI